jgi:release factor glutamine methyltransferase
MVSGEELFLWRCQAKQAAIAAGISPQEVDWLLREMAGLDSLALRLESFREQPQIALKQPLSELELLWQRRLQECFPIQYLVGSTPWRNFQLKVSGDVLIPRPETELLIDIALQAVRQSSRSDLNSGDWVDLGTGSGAIAIGLADSLPDILVHAVDRSAEALAIAQENALRLGLQERIKFYQGDWWEPLAALKGKVRGMISNPPYIPTQAIAQLQPEVVRHEPHLALDGGEDGLNCIRHLVATAPDYLCAGGIWLIETMVGQAEIVKTLLKDCQSYEQIQIFPDLAGIDRFVLAIKTREKKAIGNRRYGRV